MQKATPEELREKETLRAQWEQRLAAAPTDWSDIYAAGATRLDGLRRARRAPARSSQSRRASAALQALRFRSAHHFGYGVSAEMAARCFERCDDEGITGEVEILYVLSDTQPVATQGPVWKLGGRTI